MICFYLSESLEFVTLQAIIHYIVLEKNIENVISDLKTDLVGVMGWFKINSLKANPGKFQFMVLGNKDEISFNIHINNVKIKNSNEVTSLGIKIDKNLTFKKHILKKSITNFILYVELGSIYPLRKQNYLQMSLSTVNFANKSSIDKHLENTQKNTSNSLRRL